MRRAYVGCSGFQYDDWRGTFYPEGLAKGRWLGYYSKKFSAVELNVTFYRLPKAEAFRKWHGETPEGFAFALKGSRFITHIKRLKDPEGPVETFMERAMLLKDKLAVVLWQLPPNFKKDIGRLSAFHAALKPYKVRHAFEFRNETWLDQDVASLLGASGHALCMADWPPFLHDLPVTADFVYLRRHGREGSYATCYTDAELSADARRIRGYLKTGLGAFIFFNNDAYGYAPRNALELKAKLKPRLPQLK